MRALRMIPYHIAPIIVGRNLRCLPLYYVTIPKKPMDGYVASP
jgi:hypothetical protein